MSRSQRTKRAPRKLTDEREERILRHLRNGLTVEVAAKASGVTIRTVQRWMKLGRTSKGGRCKLFAERVEKAKADAEAHLVDLVVTHARNDWRAATWILERRHSDRWAKTQQVAVEHSGRVEQVVRVEGGADEVAAVAGDLRSRVDALVSDPEPRAEA